MTTPATVFLVDDDAAVRTAVTMSLQQAGLAVRCYASAEAFLTDFPPDHRGCLVLDVRMPNMSGIALQQELSKRQITLPVLFITGFGDVAASVSAMKNGAVDFLEKPVTPEVLLSRIREALGHDRRMADECIKRESVRQRVERLTARERQVAGLVMRGKTNKEISRALDISYRTVEKYRAMAMSKLGVGNLAELCHLGRYATALLTDPPPAQRGLSDHDTSAPKSN